MLIKRIVLFVVIVVVSKTYAMEDAPGNNNTILPSILGRTSDDDQILPPIRCVIPNYMWEDESKRQSNHRRNDSTLRSLMYDLHCTYCEFNGCTQARLPKDLEKAHKIFFTKKNIHVCYECQVGFSVIHIFDNHVRQYHLSTKYEGEFRIKKDE